ncbi:MAG: porin family protein [Bacteroidota bacterium]|nr:porin family protein [Bacteroidota bacterium]
MNNIKKRNRLRCFLKSSLVQFFKENYVINTLKKNLVIIAIFNCVWLGAQHGYKSPYRVGLKLGYSLHTLTGDLTKSHPGGNLLGGFWFQLKMNKKWTAQTELLLLDKGIGVQTGKKSPHHVNLHYFEIPVLFQYHRKKTYFEFGPGLGYMINYREHLYGNQTPDLVNNYPFMRSELSFNFGIGCALNEKWAIGLRLSHSLLPVRSAVPLVSKASYNRLLALSVTRQLKKKKASDLQE